ncbi:MAG: hypothetical protein A2270_01165 [Elusimicrobia bacterium RIFOXYA12_FULL_51_18]|nr:MAG: hypothetical protein A2270_01165 [Elusimicrobia bacterium RIFOXYA12_FULL_51_18]OGS31087.1 MAG: hypothetical protein A2218_01970 [Elusimicrobia bacterium RIFOXYA2_FULL_53_38]
MADSIQKDPAFYITITFIAGIFVQAVLPALQTRRKKQLILIPMLLCVFTALFFLSPDETRFGSLVPITVFFVLALSICFMEEMLPAISIHHATSYTLTFWAVLAQIYLRPEHGHTPYLNFSLLAVCVIMSTATLLLEFSGAIIDSSLKIPLYLWYLGTAVFMGFYLFSSRSLFSLLSPKTAPPPAAYMEAFIAGLFLTYLILLFFAGYALFMRAAKRPDRNISKLGGLKFDEKTPRTSAITAVLCAQAAFLTLNHFAGFIPHSLAVNICLVGVPALLRLLQFRTT